MSDNVTNFFGASRELVREFDICVKLSAKEISNNYVVRGFGWKFIPPSAPHIGGLWEAGVKSFNAHFKRLIGQQKYNFEEFTTILVRIESVLNSRPISPLSEDPVEFEALNPAHFLKGVSLLFAPKLPFDNI